MKFSLIISIILVSTMTSYSQTPVKTETVTLNGSTIYYEVYGKGEPLFLLHGYTWSSKSWLPYVSDYAKDFEVYLIDLKGHGKSGSFTEKISLKSVASEIDALAEYLKLDSINAIGFSYGAETLFQLALLHPGLIKSMISIGSSGSWNTNDYPHFLEYLRYENLEKLPWMLEQHTSDEQIRLILDELPNYNVSVNKEEMKSIQTQTLIVVGDRDDAVSFKCVLSAKENLPNSFLWVVPNTGHRAHMGKNKADFIRLSKEFFRTDWPN